MTLAVVDLVQALADSLSVEGEVVEQALWGALLAGLAFATIHLMTMLVTRWGDHDPTSKSLIFSVLVHLSCMFGLIAVAPPELKPDNPKVEQRLQIQNLLIEGDEENEIARKGNTPVWAKLPELPQHQLARVERSPTTFETSAGPERRPDPLTAPDIDIPDAVSIPDEPVARPELQQHADTGLRVEAAVPLKIDDVAAESRPEVHVSSISPVRRRIERSGLLERSVERERNRGSVDRVQKQFDPERQLASIASPTTPAAIRKPGTEPNVVRQRTGSAPSTLTIDDAGTDAEDSTDGTTSGSLDPSRFTRLRTRTPRNQPDGGLQRLRPERTPRTPVSKSDRVVAVHDGIRSRFPTAGFKPNVIRPNFEPIRTRKSTSVPATYRLRSVARRQDVARKYGGTDASERAVEASLRWLVLHQSPDGSWDGDGFSAHCPLADRCIGRSGRMLHGSDQTPTEQRWAGLHADAGLTALAVLAFLGAGYTHEEGQYADQIDRALSWLIRQQQDDGFLGGKATRYARMYCHAMAAYTMAEAYGMQSDPTTDTRLREPLARAIAYIVDNQNPDDGGWRYLKGQRSDMSMFGWQLMALKSAEIAGLKIPDETKHLMVHFLKKRSLGKSDGLATYRIPQPPAQSLPPTASMTAEALFCKQMLGLQRHRPQSVEAVEYLLERLPKHSEQDLYYWYYGTLAMYQYGGKPWRKWNEALRDTLVADQRTTGHAAGSWDPKAPWGLAGGRIYSTAISALCLEVYYRFLPLYQMGGKYETQ